jgi:hypothetical protein
VRRSGFPPILAWGFRSDLEPAVRARLASLAVAAAEALLSAPDNGSLQRTEAQAWGTEDTVVSRKGAVFLDYWRSKCPGSETGRRFPRRDDIRPEEIVDLLPFVFMVDVLQGAQGLDYRFRLVGTAIAAVEGEITGCLMSEMFSDRQNYRVMWQQYHDAVEGEIRVRRETLRWQDRDHIHYEVILVPLEGEAGTVDILIGLAHAQEE